MREIFIDRNELLVRLYGKMPSFSKIHILDFRFDNLQLLRLRVLLKEKVIWQPEKWKGSNAVSCEILFSGVNEIGFQYKNNDLSATFFAVDVRNEDYSGKMEGQIQMSFLFLGASVHNVSGTLI